MSKKPAKEVEHAHFEEFAAGSSGLIRDLDSASAAIPTRQHR
jgi:hypothetical protein